MPARCGALRTDRRAGSGSALPARSVSAYCGVCSVYGVLSAYWPVVCRYASTFNTAWRPSKVLPPSLMMPCARRPPKRASATSLPAPSLSPVSTSIVSSALPSTGVLLPLPKWHEMHAACWNFGPALPACVLKSVGLPASLCEPVRNEEWNRRRPSTKGCMLMPAMLVPACRKFISGLFEVSSCSVIIVPPLSALAGSTCESQGVSALSQHGPRNHGCTPPLPTW